MEAATAEQYFAESLYDGEGWLKDVRFTVVDGALQERVESSSPDGAVRLPGTVIPGMPNLHSHAFQRVMAGLAEFQTDPGDSFWTWRETMYRFAGQLNPEQLGAIASQVYLEMLGAGYTHVCEFHYLHLDPNGRPYAALGECSSMLLESAKRVGIGITLLPVVYQHGGFGGQPLGSAQRRFGLETETYLGLLESLKPSRAAGQCLGVAFHSLRAVTPETIQAIRGEVPGDWPLHIHIAEQQAEVTQCVDHCGARPVQWLYDTVGPDQRWCLVHATHLDEAEIGLIAASGAVAGLCPTTEANLGDGLFPLESYRRADGRLGIGSDSHISVSPVEELRWLEYGRRLVSLGRNRVATEAEPHCGAALWSAALDGGAGASGMPLGRIQTGYRADWVVLDDDHPLLVGRSQDTLLDALVFSGNRQPILDVWVSGRRVIVQGEHDAGRAITQDYRRTVMDLA